MRNHGGTFMQVQQTRRSWSSLFPSEFHHRWRICWICIRGHDETRFFISHVNAAFKAAQIAVFGRFINSKFHSFHDITSNERPGLTVLLSPATLSRTADKHWIVDWTLQASLSSYCDRKLSLVSLRLHHANHIRLILCHFYLVSWTSWLQRVYDAMTALPLGRRVDTHSQTCFVS